MKIIEIKSFTPPVGMEWQANSYPGDGAYVTSIGLVLITSGIVYNAGQTGLSLVRENSSNPQNAGGESISGETLLKALAIAQNPHIAVELFK